jgi:hypothetical protein
LWGIGHSALLIKSFVSWFPVCTAAAGMGYDEKKENLLITIKQATGFLCMPVRKKGFFLKE